MYEAGNEWKGTDRIYSMKKEARYPWVHRAKSKRKRDHPGERAASETLWEKHAKAPNLVMVCLNLTVIVLQLQ